MTKWDEQQIRAAFAVARRGTEASDQAALDDLIAGLKRAAETEAVWLAVKDPDTLNQHGQPMWCPGLEDSGATPTLPVWFNTEEQCFDYIVNVVTTAQPQPT